MSPLFLFARHLSNNLYRLVKSRFDTMQNIHEAHKLELEMPTQDDTFTQGTQGTTSTFSTMFTSQTGGNSTVHLTDEDLTSFQRAVDTRAAQIKGEYDEAKRRHREVEEELQKASCKLSGLLVLRPIPCF